MKNLHFIVQAKGGVGKSILMYLFALKHYKDPKCLFIDVDASTQTSTRQLKFVHQDQSDVASLLDEKGLLIRDNLLAYLQSLAKENFEEAYFDFGAPESEQLPALIEYDIPLKDFAEGLDFEITFHIVIGGGGAYNRISRETQDTQEKPGLHLGKGYFILDSNTGRHLAIKRIILVRAVLGNFCVRSAFATLVIGRGGGLAGVVVAGDFDAVGFGGKLGAGITDGPVIGQPDYSG